MSYSPQRPASAAPAGSGARCSSAKLNRRWSLDNLSADPKEGYVKDLRKLASIKDEEYPMMLTEQQQDQKKLLISRQHRSGSVDVEHLKSKSVLRGGGLQFSSSVDISSVPEESEPVISPKPTFAKAGPINKSLAIETGSGKAFLRQRSSSLPRILPPIIDEGDGSGGEATKDCVTAQQDRQSNVVVREMQKFICRQATDVSQLLPLAIPSNARQGKTLRMAYESGPPRTGQTPKQSRAKAKLVMTTLGKVHGILFSVKQTSPQLFSDFGMTLSLNPTPPVEKEHVRVFHGKLLSANIDCPPLEKLQKHISSLTSSSALPFSILTHGNIRSESIVFKYDNQGRPESLKFPGLHNASIGSPLLDIYSYILDEAAGLPWDDFLPEMLGEYHSSFNRACSFLRVNSNSLTLRQLVEDFITYYPSGYIFLRLKVPSVDEQVKKDLTALQAIQEACKFMAMAKI